MRQIDQAEPLHPLGEPTNRKPTPELTPIAVRPNAGCFSVIRTLIHAALMLVGFLPWALAMVLLTAVMGLAILGERVLPHAKRQNCWTYALPLWHRRGGYLLVRAAIGVRFLGVFAVPHVSWVKVLPEDGIELEMFKPNKRKSAFLMPWHTVYYDGKVSRREKPINAKP